MIVEYRDHTDHLDFVVPTLDEARDYIRDGALNGEELLIVAGLDERAAKLELKHLKNAMLPGYVVFPDPSDFEPPEGKS